MPCERAGHPAARRSVAGRGSARSAAVSAVLGARMGRDGGDAVIATPPPSRTALVAMLLSSLLTGALLAAAIIFAPLI